MKASVDDARIDRLPDVVATLPPSIRRLFDALYEVDVAEGVLRVPPEMVSWVEERFGAVDQVERQRLVRVLNRYTLEAASFNALRARRPIVASAAGRRAETRPDPADDALAHPLALTPDSAVGRVRGRRCVTAANVAMSESWHALVVFDEPDPLRFDVADVEDYLSTAFQWAAQVNEHDPTAVHPFVFWNATWRAGASLLHGHLQVTLGARRPYARVEALRRAVNGFRDDGHGDYAGAVADVHRALGLTADVGGGVVAFAHLTPVKEKEIVILGRGLDASFFRSVGRALVALRDALGAESFNVAVYGPPVAGNADGWDGFPVVARLVDRGPLSVRTNDIAGMELFGQSVVTADPFRVAAALRRAV